MRNRRNESRKRPKGKSSEIDSDITTNHELISMEDELHIARCNKIKRRRLR